MDSAPEIVAVTAVREVTDHARSMEELSDKRWVGEQLFVGILAFAVFVSPVVLSRLGVGVAELQMYMIVGFEYAILVGVLLAFEIYRLRRRVNALTYLLMQRERKP